MFAKPYLKAIGKESDDIISHFAATHCYLHLKKDFLDTIKKDVFKEDEKYITYAENQDTLLKSAFLAISFGAPANLKMSFYREDGTKSHGAVEDLFKSNDEYKRFITHDYVIRFIREQKLLDILIYYDLRSVNQALINSDIVKTKGGKVSKSKVVAMCYQHYETVLMQDFLYAVSKTQVSNLIPNYYKVIGKIHDGIVFNNYIDRSDLSVIIKYLRTKRDNDYIDIGYEKLERYTPKISEADIQLDIALRKSREAEFARYKKILEDRAANR